MSLRVNNLWRQSGFLRRGSHQFGARYTATFFVLLSTGAARPMFAEVIDFDSHCPGGVQSTGSFPSLFSTVGNAATLNIPTSIGTVIVQGGAPFDSITNLPADETAPYGTAGNAANIGVSEGSGFTNPLTIAFPKAVNNVFLDVVTGNTINVDYRVADNTAIAPTSCSCPTFPADRRRSGCRP